MLMHPPGYVHHEYNIRMMGIAYLVPKTIMFGVQCLIIKVHILKKFDTYIFKIITLTFSVRISPHNFGAGLMVKFCIIQHVNAVCITIKQLQDLVTIT